MYVISITVHKRETEVPEIQEVLTKYGEKIIARLGLHACEKEYEGMIIVVYNDENIEKFVYDLQQVKGVFANHMKV